MSTIPQQLIEIAERAIKSGAKTGKECAAYTREHQPKLAKDYISHLFLAFKMVKKAAQFAPAIKAVKEGASGTLAQIAKPYQGASGPREPKLAPVVANHALVTARRVGKMPELGAPYGIDNDLATALGLGAEPRGKSKQTVVLNPTKFKPPHIADAVFDEVLKTVMKGKKK